jgi:CRP-like cAMP-binding protein
VIDARREDFEVSVVSEASADEVPGAIVIEEDPIVIDEEADLDAERIARMAGATLFADVPRDALADIAREAERVAFPDRAAILTAGEPADALLVIVEGRALVRIAGRSPIEVCEGDVLGETTIIGGAVRTANVFARGAFVALRVGKAALDRIVAKHPPVEDVLFGLLARRLVADALDTSPLFAPFDPPTRAEIARAFEVRRARPGTMVQEKGKKGDGLYLLLSGTMAVLDGDAARPLPYGSLVGYETLVTRAPADHSVIVPGEAVLLRLPATKFSAFATEYPPALAHLAELAAAPGA